MIIITDEITSTLSGLCPSGCWGGFYGCTSAKVLGKCQHLWAVPRPTGRAIKNCATVLDSHRERLLPVTVDSTMLSGAATASSLSLSHLCLSLSLCLSLTLPPLSPLSLVTAALF